MADRGKIWREYSDPAPVLTVDDLLEALRAVAEADYEPPFAFVSQAEYDRMESEADRG